MANPKPKKIRADLTANLLWLECKQVIRGFPSTIFPGLDKPLARRIRAGGKDYLQAVVDQIRREDMENHGREQKK